MLACLFLLGGVQWFLREKVLEGNSDFTSFYTGVRLVRNHSPTLLYDLETQRRVQHEILGRYELAGGLMAYLHPPHELLLFLPFQYLTYSNAFLTWLGVNLGLLLSLPWAIGRASPELLARRRGTLLLAALAFYPFLVCLWQGQPSILFLMILVWTFVLLRRSKPFSAGVVLGLAFIKFQLMGVVVLALALKRRRKELLGIACTVSVLVLTSILWLGREGMQRYLDLLVKISGTHGEMGVSPERMHHWLGQFYALGFEGAQSLWGAGGAALLALGLLLLIWRRGWDTQETNFGLRFAATLLLALLSSSYLFIHDLSPLFMCLALSLEYLLTAPAFGWKQSTLAGMLGLSPLVWVLTLPVSQQAPVQLSVLWMSLMLFLLLAILQESWRAAGTQPESN